MIRPTAFALAVVAIGVHCAADPILHPRAPPGCYDFWCPPRDLGHYPLAEAFSGPYVDPGNGIAYIACYYPFVPNCQYSLLTGSLQQDFDSTFCPQTACDRPPCRCPSYDVANYPLGDSARIDTEDVLFCSYPVPQQPLVNTYYCNYAQVGGELLYGVNPSTPPVFCPAMAVALPTPTCSVHSAVVAPSTMVIPPSRASNDAITAKSTSRSASPTRSPTSHCSRALDLSWQGIGIAMMSMAVWVVL